MSVPTPLEVQSNFTLTRNQQVVWDTLRASDRPLSAYTLLSRIEGGQLRAPLQVYRALDKLIAFGLVHRLESINAFVACSHRHQGADQSVGFAICDDCGHVEEFAQPAVWPWPVGVVSRTGLCGPRRYRGGPGSVQDVQEQRRMNALGSTIGDPIPVYLVTGFLGSGKTTLLNRILQQDGPRTAVVVNEFGDVPIDNDLFKVDGTTSSLIETSTGCICCEPGNDIESTLFRLSNAIDDGEVTAVERVVVETTGLADPETLIAEGLARRWPDGPEFWC